MFTWNLNFVRTLYICTFTNRKVSDCELHSVCSIFIIYTLSKQNMDAASPGYWLTVEDLCQVLFKHDGIIQHRYLCTRNNIMTHEGFCCVVFKTAFSNITVISRLYPGSYQYYWFIYSDTWVSVVMLTQQPSREILFIWDLTFVTLVSYEGI